MTVYELLATLGYPIAYGFHSKKQDPPFLCIIGAGQEPFSADNTYYTRQDKWQIEYYFKDKNPEIEATIEQLLLDNGYLYDKSEDVYLEDEDVFLIYYDI